MFPVMVPVVTCPHALTVVALTTISAATSTLSFADMAPPDSAQHAHQPVWRVLHRPTLPNVEPLPVTGGLVLRGGFAGQLPKVPKLPELAECRPGRKDTAPQSTPDTAQSLELAKLLRERTVSTSCRGKDPSILGKGKGPRIPEKRRNYLASEFLAIMAILAVLAN